jgi:hypothetical protein
MMTLHTSSTARLAEKLRRTKLTEKNISVLGSATVEVLGSDP